jgi:hypothetical protein
MKKLFVLCLLVMMILESQGQDRTYGPFWGIHAYTYKSNLFNSDDLRADSFQKYQLTLGAAGSVEYGYLYESGFSVSGGIEFGTNNQKYTGSDPGFPFTMNATTKVSFLKIPIVFGLQAHQDRKLKYMYTLGFFYSYNTGYSDVRSIDYDDQFSKAPTEFYEITKDTYTMRFDTTALQTVLSMDQRPIVRNGFGALAGLGVNYRLTDKVQFLAQVKAEFTITNIESLEKTRFKYVNGANNTIGFPYSDYVYKNYAKYMHQNDRNWNRSGTHPFNLGLTLGIRYYLYDFDSDEYSYKK